MEAQDFTSASPGSLVKNLEGRITFLPRPLPPPVGWLVDLTSSLHEAILDAGRLDGSLSAQDGIDPQLLLRPLLQREATLSSRIEGTRTDEAELALFELRQQEESPSSDAREVGNYLHALEWGVSMVRERGITSTLIRQLHARLMEGVRGGDQKPGSYRDRQVYIGSGAGSIDTARFVPPPSGEVSGLMDDLVRFIRENRTVPPLVRAALAHYQFEAIHPFRDGNGRVGRLLLALQMMHDMGMRFPALHLSPFIERTRRSYYDGLLAVSQRGDWSGWTAYLLTGVTEQAREVIAAMQRLRDLRRDYQRRLSEAAATGIGYRLIDLLFERPAVDLHDVVTRLGVSKPAAGKHIQRLVSVGVLREVTGKERGREYLAEEIIRTAREAPADR